MSSHVLELKRRQLLTQWPWVGCLRAGNRIMSAMFRLEKAGRGGDDGT